MSGNISVRIDPNTIQELDRVAKMLGIDRASIIRRIIDDGIERERINLGIELFQKGETMDRASELSRASIWDLIDEAKSRGIVAKFDIDQEKALFMAVLGKDDPELARKISKL
ncbi:MAG: ribbon-helix-helix protein, CopG family [Candidatus Lokiarchaeota archaeon]|nr:ribbon-helix-helix protein, CopG family [Candidatus Lokiarchaeota archaeon]